MGTKVVQIRIDFDDMSGRIIEFNGYIAKKGHDKLHSGSYNIVGDNKTKLMKELNRYI